MRTPNNTPTQNRTPHKNHTHHTPTTLSIVLRTISQIQSIQPSNMFHRQALRALIPRAARSISATPIAAVSVRSSELLFRSNATPSSVRPFSMAAVQKISNPDMMCRQCEQTQDHYACTTVGVCGKTAETSVRISMI